MNFIKNLFLLTSVLFGLLGRTAKSLRRRPSAKRQTSRFFRPGVDWSTDVILEERLAPTVDFAPYALFAPSNAAAGSTINVSTGVSNYGSTASGSFYIGYYASTTPYISTSSTLLKTDYRSSIGGWSSQSWTESITLPSSLTGTFYIGVIADPYGFIAETNKANNTLAAYSPTTIAAPVQVDLAPYTVNAPSNAAAGSTINVSTGVSNYGSTASGSFYIGYYASTTPYISTSSTLLKTDYRSSIGGWSSQSWTESITLPSSLTGTFYIGVIADPYGFIAETNKANNTLAAYSPTTIAAPVQVDLAPYTVNAPSNAAAGSTINVSTGVSNYGSTASGSFYIGYYASTTPYISTSSTLLKTDYRSSIGGWSSQSWTESITLPSSLTGTFYIGVIADPYGFIAETNKANNTLAAYSPTTIAAPVQVDLAPYTVNAPSNAAAGSTINVSTGVSNYGSTASGSFYIGYYASTTPYISTSSTLLKTDYRSSIGGWSSQSWTESITLPSSLTGTFYIGVIADPYGFIAETNKANNTLAAYSTTMVSAVATTSNPNAILNSLTPTGASDVTAKQDGLPARGIHGVLASQTMAQTDLARVMQTNTAMQEYVNAGELYGLPPALLAAIASRESRGGNALVNGWGDGGNAFGVMQIDARYHNVNTDGGPFGQATINQAASILRDYLNQAIARFPTLTVAQQLQYAVAAYNGGTGVFQYSNPDIATTGQDYSNDVLARAQYYARVENWS